MPALLTDSGSCVPAAVTPALPQQAWSKQQLGLLTCSAAWGASSNATSFKWLEHQLCWHALAPDHSSDLEGPGHTASRAVTRLTYKLLPLGLRSVGQGRLCRTTYELLFVFARLCVLWP